MKYLTFLSFMATFTHWNKKETNVFRNNEKKKKDYLGNFELFNTETVWWPKKKPDETLEHYLSL